MAPERLGNFYDGHANTRPPDGDTTDWPFINLTEKPDYRQALSCLERWVPGKQDRRKILWDTPAKLFGFKRECDDGKS